MTPRNSPRNAVIISLLTLLAIGAAPLRAQTPEKRLASANSKLQSVETAISGQDGILAEKRKALEFEYGRLVDPKGRKALVARVDELAKKYRSGESVPDADVVKPVVQRELAKTIETLGGPNIVPFIVEDLALNLADRLSDEKFPAEEVVQISFEDRFGERDFSQNFDGWMKQQLSPELGKLLQQREILQAEIKDLEAELEAARKGIPHGMVEVPAGKRTVGFDEKDIETMAKIIDVDDKPEQIALCWRSSPAHEVELPSFFIDRREVTCGWYAAFLADNPGVDPPKDLWVEGKLREGWDDRPVTNISLPEAERFARWMGRRLPTEFEWETAARASNDRRELRIWPWGDTWSVTDVRANVDLAYNFPPRRAIPEGLPPMLPVGTFPEGRSLLGLDDLCGNAAEWTTSPFTPYPGFKTKKIKVRRIKGGNGGGNGLTTVTVTQADFAPREMVIRGGYANQRDRAVTTTWRLSMPAQARSPYVGFRTAVSAIRGQDHIAYIAGDEIKRFLVDQVALPSDRYDRRRYSALENEDPSGFAAMMAGGWDPERNLPCRAEWVSLVRRRADDFRNANTVRQLAEDKILFLGLLQTDVAFTEPALDPGIYFVYWQNAYEVKPEEPDPATTDPKEKDPKKKPKPPKRGKKEEPKIIPEAILIQNIYGRKRAPLRIELGAHADMRDSVAQPSKITALPDGDTFEFLYAFPIRHQDNKAFVISLRFKTAPGAAARFR